MPGAHLVGQDGRDQNRGCRCPGAGRATFEAHFVVLSGSEIREPVVGSGLFIMHDRSQFEASFERYHAGRVGRLAPFSEGRARSQA